MEIPPCSYSLLDAYETCPFKYYGAKVSRKYPDAQNEASLWGNRVHKSFEVRLADKLPLSESMKQWEPLAQQFEELGGKLLVEHRFALSRQFSPAVWKYCWFRGVIDVAVLKKKRAVAFDWKTGKPKPDTGQLQISAAALMHTYPFIESVTTGYIWLKDDSLKDATYTRDDLPTIWEEILPRVMRWENAYRTEKWEKRPSGLCKGWCNNLDCTFNERRNSNEENPGLETSPARIPR